MTTKSFIRLAIGSVLLSALAYAQPASTSASPAVVPRLVNFSGKVVDSQVRTFSGSAGVTFAIYREQSEGSPLWVETQTVTLDTKGNYTAQLGATKTAGLPLDLFTSGEARWLGVRVNGGEEQPRVLLLSVPYALKAADAETIGGLPPSAFVLATPAAVQNAASSSAGGAAPTNPSVTGAGTAGQIPLWDSSSDLTNSILTQTGSGSMGRVGINITSPSTTLDVKGTSNFRGTVTMPSAGLATASAGKTSYPFVFATSAYSSSAKASVLQNFRWQAEPLNNNSNSATGQLNLLFSSGTNTPAETGLSIASNGQITFAPGQTFPGGSGTGTVTSVGLSAPNTDFSVTGSPVTTSGTLAVKWNVAPTSANTANAIVKRDANGNFTANLINAGNLQVTASGEGIGSVSTGNFPTTAAISGRSEATGDGTTHGVNGFSSTNQGAGIFGENTVSGNGVLGYAAGTSGQGVWGESVGTQFDSNGQGADGVHGQAHSSAGSGVAGLNSDLNGVGVYGQGTGYYSNGSGYGVYGVGNTGVYGGSLNGTGVYGTTIGGFGFATDSNVQQARAAGGWVKAMALVSGFGNGGKGSIYRCFNSTLPGAAATTVPCGFSLDRTGPGDYIVDFGFEIDDRFASATPVYGLTVAVCTNVYSSSTCIHTLSANQAEITAWNNSLEEFGDENFSLIIF
jgi:hypothetical protein